MKPFILVLAILSLIALAMTGTVCLGSWLDNQGGCPAKMPWEMR